MSLPCPLQDQRRVDFSANPMSESTFAWYDQSLLDEVGVNEDVDDFFRCLALCHTVMPAETKGQKKFSTNVLLCFVENDLFCFSDGLEYQAQSPDENALVSAARNFGFVFLRRTPNSITMSFRGEVREICRAEIVSLFGFLVLTF